MHTERIILDRDQARALWRDYRKHQHYSAPIDREVMRTYQAIAQGRIVIKALESITTAGLNAERLPKLAIARADATRVWLHARSDGSAVFAIAEDALTWHEHKARHRFAFPPGSFPNIATQRYRPCAIVPQAPLPLRPKRGLANYHVLFEPEWEMVPPVDPMLIRRIGQGDLWMVCAAWDLTPVEQAALAARVSA